MASLKDKANNILDEKTTNLLPENIKKDITVLGVTGTYNGPDTGIKLFETLEEMNSDTNAKEGDLAAVYRNEITNMTSDSVVSSITFPETVTLQSAFTDNVYCMLRSVDSSIMFDSTVMINSNSFRFDGFTDSGMIMVEYSSEDGITYNRTRFTGDSGDLTNPVDFGTTIQVYMPEEWNDNFGYFMQVGGNTFEGLYEYGTNTDLLKFNLTSGISVTDDGVTYNNVYSEYGLSLSAINEVINKIQENEGDTITTIALNGDTLLGWNSTDSSNSSSGVVLDESNAIIGYTSGHIYGYVPSINVYTFDLDNKTYSNKTTVQEQSIIVSKSSPSGTNLYGLTVTSLPYVISDGVFCNEVYSILNNDSYYYFEYSISPIKIYANSYVITSTQLDATADLLYNSIAYGKNGVIEGTITQNVSNSFADVNAEIYCKIQQVYNNMELRVLTDSDKTIDKNIYFIPTKSDGTPLLDTNQVTDMSSMFSDCNNLDEIPLLDTSNVTNMSSMFSGCDSLTTIPQLNTSSVTNMNNMFYGCSNLTTIPLLDTSKVTNMNYMFSSCSSLTTIPLLDTSKVTNMGFMFGSCSSLTTIPQLDTSSVTDMNSMFYDCSNLTTIPQLYTSKVTNMNYMFYSCSSLTTIPQLDTSSVTDMYNMFCGCSSLTTIPLLNTNQVTNMGYMFNSCSSLTTVPQLDTSKVTNMERMFSSCFSLTTIPQLDTSSVTAIYKMFDECPNLSDESLNNILFMCTNMVNINYRKTLANIGLTEEQAQKCTTLSNYEAFTSAGWTTGY